MFLRNYFTPYQNNVTSMVVCHQMSSASGSVYYFIFPVKEVGFESYRMKKIVLFKQQLQIKYISLRPFILFIQIQRRRQSRCGRGVGGAWAVAGGSHVAVKLDF